MIFNKAPRLDYGKQSRKALATLLKNALKVHGLPAQIFRPKAYINDYQPYAPEFTQDKVPSGQCLVLLGQPFEGINLTHFISLADKVEKQIHVTTNVELNIEDELRVTFPEPQGKTLNLRVIENWAYHAHSDVLFRYVCLVT